MTGGQGDRERGVTKSSLRVSLSVDMAVEAVEPRSGGEEEHGSRGAEEQGSRGEGEQG